MRSNTARSGAERGQVTVVLAVLLALLALAIVGLTVIGRAAIDRTRVTSAADAVALAAAQSGSAGAEVAQWYRDHGIEIEAHDTGAGTVRASAVTSGGNQTRASATSWAEVGPGPISVSPALIAVISRAEQLLGVDLAVTYPSSHIAVTGAEHRAALAGLFESLLLCTTSSGAKTAISLCLR